jgi:hypothetical protein
MDQKFFVGDGVHLSNLGCQIFLNTLQGGIEMIRMKWGDNVAFNFAILTKHAVKTCIKCMLGQPPL